MSATDLPNRGARQYKVTYKDGTHITVMADNEQEARQKATHLRYVREGRSGTVGYQVSGTTREGG